MHLTFESLPVSYDAKLVALSILVASFVAYVALCLGERVTQHRGRAKAYWTFGAAVALGSGIWSTNFTGMLAYRLPVPVRYDASTVAVALVVAIVASGIALALVARPVARITWLVAGTVIGLEIATVQFAGMAAMRLDARPVWDVRFLVLGAFVAIFSSLVALRLIFDPRSKTVRRDEWSRLTASLLFGFAVAAMHQTSMAAATFLRVPHVAPAGLLIGATALGSGAISLASLVALIASLAIAFVDRRMRADRSALEMTRDRLHAVLSSTPVILFALGAKGTIKMAEGRDLSRLGYVPSDGVGRPFWEVFAAVPEWVEQARRALAGEEFTAISFLGDTVIEMRWTAVRHPEGMTSVIAVGTDITERRRAEDALRYQAFHDALTGLPNRAAFNSELGAAIATAAAERSTVVLALLDLNRFKHVNDTQGHELGDALLGTVAERLVATVPADRYLARLGGDEFAIVLRGATRAEGEQLARDIATALKLPFDVNGTSLEIGAAIGLASYPEDAVDATTLLRLADVAMYVAKRAGIGYALYEVYADAESEPRVMLENALRKAITNDELVLHYQPTVDIAFGRVTTVEALVRWEHATLGRLPPDRFIPIAEESGLILPMTRWVLDEALRTNAAWRRTGLDVRIAVNLSAHSLRDSALPRVVESLLKKHDVAPEKLTLEITETALMENMDITRHLLAKVSALGVSISVDDFGTGYSSLAYLAQLPVDELKIDRSFVMKMHANVKDAEIVRWINGLGHVLGLRVVAEGVETDAVLETLRDLGCDVAQGYFFSRPLPAAELETWVRSSPWGLPEPTKEPALRLVR